MSIQAMMDILNACNPEGKAEIIPAYWDEDGGYLSAAQVYGPTFGKSEVRMRVSYHQRMKIPWAEGVNWSALGTRPADVARGFAKDLEAAADFCDEWNRRAKERADEYAEAFQNALASPPRKEAKE